MEVKKLFKKKTIKLKNKTGIPFKEFSSFDELALEFKTSAQHSKQSVLGYITKHYIVLINGVPLTP
jgi:hypothetical protein